ncbi:BFD-like (2Fe-2S) protein [Trichloromonas acetexigens]|uniref:BFD-like (2Fe-2S) protein n=1 Tax=Trichloromonas acetexigens TaxID=38815 RepID=A0A550JKM0_9BACT|nr:BFD-like (2Fe-2S) protein [Desulfuromonas acetexigens]TRO83760.1 BFD-like (2Fe-2S) protein [Desulfuromonas acetexigens]
MSVPICYCYGYDEDDIRADVCANGGRSLILERILAEKRQGTCRCAETHPDGR